MSEKNWGIVPFIEYLNEVDRILEERTAQATSQETIDYVALCQEEGISPEECVDEILEGNAWLQ